MGALVPSDSRNVPPERALLVVDMKDYSQLPEAKMAAVRSDLDDILDTVFAQSDLGPRSHDGTYKDTGDGAIFVLPTTDAARLVDPLLGHLNAALGRYDETRLTGQPPIRLRVSVHTGPLSLPDHRGDAINEACRLVNSQAVRGAMAAALEQGVFVAAVLSEPAFHRTVHAGRTPNLQPAHFLTTTARVEGKAGFEEPCRLHVPGLSAQMLHLYLSSLAQSLSPGPDTTAAETAPAAAGSTFQFHAPLYDATVAGEIGTLRISRGQR